MASAVSLEIVKGVGHPYKVVGTEKVAPRALNVSLSLGYYYRSQQHETPTTAVGEAARTGLRRNIEMMWLTGKLAPDFKTIADFRRDNGDAIRAVCRQFVMLCRGIGLIGGAKVAVDGSRFKAVNARDKNYTPGAIRLRLEQVDASIARY